MKQSEPGKPPFRLVVLISGNGSNLQALLDHIATDKLAATIAAVISNKPDAGGLARAQQAGIPTIVVDHRAHASRELFDAALINSIDRYRPNAVILAGFMRILTPAFVQHYDGRLLNIHPSLLPKFAGLHTHARALAAGEREHGCTVHFVNGELDGGPAVAQSVVPIMPDDTAEALRARVQTAEHALYPAVINWLATGRLLLTGNNVTLDGNLVTQGSLRYITAKQTC